MKPLSDSQVMEGIQATGLLQNHALTFLYWKMRPLVMKHILANSGSREDALDVLQDGIVVFLELVKQGRFKEESALSTFLFGICKRIWLNQLSRKKLGAKYLEQAQQEEIFNESLHDLYLLGDEKKDCWEKLLQRNAGDYRQIIHYRYTEGFSMEEIASFMGFKNDQNARNKLYKCKQELKNQIRQFQAEQPECADQIFAA